MAEQRKCAYCKSEKQTNSFFCSKECQIKSEQRKHAIMWALKAIALGLSWVFFIPALSRFLRGLWPF